MIRALQTLRGVKEVTAATPVAEIGCFSRFRNPGQLIGTGNPHVRRIVIESA
ncbi:MAG: transposase [Firmicutes bacterium]|nr:transposase [Bacillota bacterium]